VAGALADRRYRHGAPLRGIPAAAGVKRHVNAFVAMLLMPPVLANRHVTDLEFSDIADVEAIEVLADSMGTGFPTTLEHLTDIG
jgi:hypothetical protein